MAQERGSNGRQADSTHGAFKAQDALATLKGDRAINELPAYSSVHPTMILSWKKQLHQAAEAKEPHNN